MDKYLMHERIMKCAIIPKGKEIVLREKLQQIILQRKFTKVFGKVLIKNGITAGSTENKECFTIRKRQANR